MFLNNLELFFPLNHLHLQKIMSFRLLTDKETMVTDFKCIGLANCSLRKRETRFFNSLKHKLFFFTLPKFCFLTRALLIPMHLVNAVRLEGSHIWGHKISVPHSFKRSKFLFTVPASILNYAVSGISSICLGSAVNWGAGDQRLFFFVISLQSCWSSVFLSICHFNAVLC
jgi:hypothetical protein